MLDVAFDFTGQHLATASADGTARVYNAITHNCVAKLEGHEGEVSKVSHPCFVKNPRNRSRPSGEKERENSCILIQSSH